MSDRRALARDFLSGTEFADAARSDLAGDASNRRYERLRRDDGAVAVLMDAPPDREDVQPFLRISRHLTALGLSAPRILAADTDAGFLLLEDLGDALFARVLEDPDGPDEERLYSAAIDVLVELYEAPLPRAVVPYDAPLMNDAAALALVHYADAEAGTRDAFSALMGDLLSRLLPPPTVLALRDFHAENLIWLPEREDTARVGLLDFQDAMACAPGYDLVSLLQDARRDVPEALEEAMIARFCTRAGLDETLFRPQYALLGAQRNLRIIGVFARLCLRDGKPRYLDLIPRVWGLLQRDLAHEALAPLRDFLADHLPDPDPDRLQTLKDRCATVPTA